MDERYLDDAKLSLQAWFDIWLDLSIKRNEICGAATC